MTANVIGKKSHSASTGLSLLNSDFPFRNGRLFIGTLYEDEDGSMLAGRGSLFRLDGRQLTRIFSNRHISNGMAWKKDDSKVDPTPDSIFAFSEIQMLIHLLFQSARQFRCSSTTAVNV